MFCFSLLIISDYDIAIESNSELIYEYQIIDENLLSFLILEDYSYSELLSIINKTRIMWRINQISESINNWVVLGEIFRGEAFNIKSSEIDFIIFKNPSDLIDEILNFSYSDVYFIPFNVSTYLDGCNNSIPMIKRDFLKTSEN